MHTYKGKPVELLAVTYVSNGKQYCTILMENRLGRKQRQSVLLRHLTPVAPDAATPAPLRRRCCVHGEDLNAPCEACDEETESGYDRLVCGPDPDGEPGYPPRR